MLRSLTFLLLLSLAGCAADASGARYERCAVRTPPCDDEGFDCISVDRDIAMGGTFCSRSCRSTDECPASPVYGATVCITAGVFGGQCFVRCGVDADCPPENFCDTAGGDGTRFCVPD